MKCFVAHHDTNMQRSFRSSREMGGEHPRHLLNLSEVGEVGNTNVWIHYSLLSM